MRKIIAILFFVFVTCSLQAQTKTKFTRQDSMKLNFCACDSLSKSFIEKSNSKDDAPDFDGNGWHKLLNFQKQIGQCGYFNKFYFMYGLHFIYDENGKLTKIKKFFNGKMIGLCEVKK